MEHARYRDSTQTFQYRLTLRMVELGEERRELRKEIRLRWCISSHKQKKEYARRHLHIRLEHGALGRLRALARASDYRASLRALSEMSELDSALRGLGVPKDYLSDGMSFSLQMNRGVAKDSFRMGSSHRAHRL